MQEKVDIHPYSPTIEKLHHLRIIELGLQKIIERDLRRGARHGDGPIAALEDEDADLVAGDGEVDVLELAVGVAGPGEEDAAVGQLLGGVLEGAEFGDAARAGEFALVVPLLGEGHEEAFLALFVLQRYHCLLDVIVVGLELAFQVDGLVVQPGEGKADGFEFPLPLHAAAVFRADVDCDGVQEVLVVVVAGEAADVFQAEDVF